MPIRAPLVAVVAAAAMLGAQLLTPNALADAKKRTLNSYDEKFVKQAGQSSKDEAKLAELGTKKAERTDVKNLAEMLLKDRSAMNLEMERLATSKDVYLSAVISPEGAQRFKNLERYFGATFDRAFVMMMESAQSNAISSFEKAEKKVADGDLKVWVSRTLVSLRLNMDLLKDVKSKLPVEQIPDSTPPF